MDLVLSVLEQGLIYGIMALGVYISYHILDFPDLSVDGTFPLGAAVTASLLVAGVNPWLCLVLSFFAGAAAGCVTGLLHVKLKIKNLLSGILTMTALYSINYRIAGAPNLFLIGERSIFDAAKSSPYLSVAIVLVLAVAAKLLLDWYLKTKSGFLLRATGNNAQLVTSLGKDAGYVKIIGLAISNGLVALAGAVNCQKIMQFDISSGVGTIVMGLAAVIIGMTLLGRVSFVRGTTAVLVGAVLYKACIMAAMLLGFESSDMNLIIVVLFLPTLVLGDRFKKKGEF